MPPTPPGPPRRPACFLLASVLAIAAALAASSPPAAASTPALVFSTYMGGTGGEFHPQSAQAGIVVDAAGNVYVAGDAAPASGSVGLDFPLSPGAVLTDLRGGSSASRGRDIFVAKLDPTGSALLWLTYLGGSGTDDLASLALGPDGSLYVSGRTTSTDLPVTTGAAQPTLAGGVDAFVARLAPDGAALTYLTYLGGTGSDHPNALAVDASGHAYVAGTTDSSNYPTTAGAYRTTRNGSAADAFVTKLAPSGTSLVFSTYFGGTGVDQAFSVSVASGGEVVIAGQTTSTNLPLAAAYQPTLLGATDVFVTRFNASATALVFSTYFGGTDPSSAPEQARAALAPNGDIVVAGFTGAPDFPRLNPAQTTFGGGLDAFVARFRWTGSTLVLVHSTYLGGSSGDAAFGLAVDPSDHTVVVGATQSANFPTSNALDTSLGGDQDAFVAKLDPTGALVFSTYVGGTTDPFTSSPERVGADVALAAVTDAGGGIAVVGQTGSADFPALSLGGGTPYDGTQASSEDAFVFRLGDAVPPAVTAVAPNSGPVAGGISAALTGTGFSPGATVRFGGTPATNVVVQSPTSLTVTVPYHAAGPVDVVVTNPDGRSGTLASGFTFAASAADADGDGLPDDWESQYGVSDPEADPDNDGAPNRKEFQDGTNPIVAELRYFAEGASSTFFTTRFALVNPDPIRTATVVLQFSNRAGQLFYTAPVITLPPRSRRTVEPKADYPAQFPLVPPPPAAHVEFSTAVRSNLPVVADRTMTWDGSGYASHSERAIETPADTWYLAEGATISGFQLFYLVQAVDPDVAIDVRYMFKTGGFVDRCYGAVGCARGNPNDAERPINGRFNIWVNKDSDLDNKELSAVITARGGKRIIVERAMYLDSGGLFFGAGHESAGITEPKTQWFFAEGATGDFFDLFILIGNPNPTPATISATYFATYHDNGVWRSAVCTKTYTNFVNPFGRENIWVDMEVGSRAPAGCEPDVLADAAVSVAITSDIPVIAERAMWWPGGLATWAEAHNSAGATETGTSWAVADGEVGNAFQAETYILVANQSSYPGRARVSLFFEDDGTVVTRTVALPPNSRTNVPVGVPPSLDPAGFGDVAQNRRFGAVVESVAASGQSAPAQIVVERAMYSNGPGAAFWAAGTNALATKLQ